MGIDVESQNSILGLMILNQNVTVADLFDGKERGLYFSRIFQKPSNHIWYQCTWTDNKTSARLDKIDIDTRIRTGDKLPFNKATNKAYTIPELNAKIKNGNPNEVDEAMYKWHLGRSMLGIDNNSTTTTADNDRVIEFGTATNTTRSASQNKAVWNYWSLPRLHKKTYVANNVNHDYLQLRIDLKSLDKVTLVQMYKITISSILIQGTD